MRELSVHCELNIYQHDKDKRMGRCRNTKLIFKCLNE